MIKKLFINFKKILSSFLSDKESITTISDKESLARFVFESNRIRKDKTVKPDAFMPNINLETSVTIKSDLSDLRLWEIGQIIATNMNKPLYGHADIIAADVRKNSVLDIVPKPETDNPNHANIIGWPEDKDKKKILAQELAAVATYFPKTES